mgnify:CR=1 FL=1
MIHDDPPLYKKRIKEFDNFINIGKNNIELLKQDFTNEFIKLIVKQEDKDVKKELEGALKRLPERERTIMVLYYHENMTLKEIGEAINISESRVSQLHAQAIMKLKNLLSFILFSS